ncbi:MAG: hypothetical protein KGY67_00330 [Candidatus Thermoplasmatota archaeon]|nr:hypothetical protein [Candidatus Thermoplasmatota archaeon]
MVYTVEFSEWKEKTIKGKIKALSNTHYFKQKSKYRDIILPIDDLKLEEGIVLDYAEKIRGEKEYKRNQQHLVGYHFIGIIKKIKKDEHQDIFWIQGNKNRDSYIIFEREKIIKNWDEKNKVMQIFFDELEKRYNIKVINHGIFKNE